MIGILKGVILNQNIVMCDSVGYEVELMNSSMFSSKQEVTVFVHTHTSNDRLVLFGFPTLEHKLLFRALIRVSGVGPSAALNILNQMSISEVVQAALSKQPSAFSTVKGVGTKMANSLALNLAVPSEISSASSAAASPYSNPVFQALTQLGYSESKTRQILNDLTKREEFTSEDELLRAALKELRNNNA